MNKIIALIGETGSGKSTIERRLIDYAGVFKILSDTTREPREHEINGVDYNFVTDETFAKTSHIAQQEFATKETFGKNVKYGINPKEIEDKLKIGDCVIPVTVSGYMELSKKFKCVGFYIETDLKHREVKLLSRCGDNEMLINECYRRLKSDIEDFRNIPDDLTILHNDYTEEGLIDNIETIIRKLHFS